MKIIAYGCAPEVRPIFEQCAPEFGADLTLVRETLEESTAALARGMDCVNVLSDRVLTRELYDTLLKEGVKLAVTRTIGYEHMNLPAAKAAGMPVCSITYSHESVADYAILLMLMVLRRVKPMLRRYAAQDYTFAGLRGREMHSLSVGIAGYGNIGRTVARELGGFGCRVLAWDGTPREDGAAQMVTLDELLGQSDVISLHLSASPATAHFMDGEKLAKMKPGAVLINTARGSLVDSDALIAALESGHLGGAGLDMFDGDRGIYYRDMRRDMVIQHQKAILDSMPNVVMLPHAAFCTEEAARDMVRNSLLAARLFFDGAENPFRIA